MNATHDDLEAASKAIERWEWGCGGLVVAGLLGELVIAWLHLPYDSFWERWGSVLGDFLVTLGVAGEIIFSVMGHRFQSELTRRSNERAAKLEKEAADARERTAEIERVTASRKISDEQSREIVEALRGKIDPAIDVLIEWERGDTEAYLYSWQIAVILEKARDGAKIRGRPNSWLNWQGWGVHAHADPSIDLSSITAVFAESGVLIKIGDRNATRLISWGGSWPPLYIFVAAKPPPGLEEFSSVLGDVTPLTQSEVNNNA